MNRWPIYSVIIALLGCQDPPEGCGQWTDFAASFGIDESQVISCGSYGDHSSDEEVAEIKACLKTAYNDGQLAKMHYSFTPEETSSQADSITYHKTSYVRPADQEPRYLELHRVHELWEDGTTTDEYSVLACDEVVSCEWPGPCCDRWRKLCP